MKHTMTFKTTFLFVLISDSFFLIASNIRSDELAIMMFDQFGSSLEAGEVFFKARNVFA